MVLSHVSHPLAGWPGLVFTSGAEVQESKQKCTRALTGLLAVGSSFPIGQSVPRGPAEPVREEAGEGRGRAASEQSINQFLSPDPQGAHQVVWTVMWMGWNQKP